MLLEQLGRGGTGRVYAGTQGLPRARVAVKVMRPDLDPEDDQGFEDRFFREASLAGRLQHPNIVTVHDYGRSADGVCYIVMELLGGSDLRALMQEGPSHLPGALDLRADRPQAPGRASVGPRASRT